MADTDTQIEAFVNAPHRVKSRGFTCGKDCGCSIGECPYPIQQEYGYPPRTIPGHDQKVFPMIGVHHKHFASDIEKAINQIQSSGLSPMPEIDNETFFKLLVRREGFYCPRCGRAKNAVAQGRCPLCSPGLPFVNETIAALFPAKRTIKSVVKTFTSKQILFFVAACLPQSIIIVAALIRYLKHG